ncbi:MAG: polysaccharide deacetylase family protein [Clostridia bacterium]|nr:polysaccharide deacetylase family protein [Clostridia bacterium]
MKKTRLTVSVVLAAIIIVIAVGGIIFRLNKFKIEFSVPSGETDTVEWGGEYTKPEVKAYLKGKINYKSGKEIDLNMTGEVDTLSLGEYVIKWSASAAGADNSGIRIVNVVDTKPPQITLNEYKKEFIYVGEKYEEPGFLAVDEVDGDLTASVQVSAVDTSAAGEKEIVYTVADKSGNKTSASRKITVKVKPPPPPPTVSSNPAAPNGKVIYLTFDDGPGPYTAKLLDVLAKYNVKATFFVTGRAANRDMIAREAREGHTVAIHTFSHNYAQIYSSEQAYFNDLNAMNEIIKAQTGAYSNLLRFPGGSSNTVSAKYCKGIMTRLAAAVTEKGFIYFDWNVTSGDAGGASTSNQVYTNVIRGIGKKQYAIVLQHDIKSFSVNAVESIIIWGKNNGYTFAPLTSSSPAYHQRIGN